MKLTVKLTFEKATKRTFRFREDEESPVIGTLYIKQSALNGKAPESIVVTIETEEV